MTHHPITKDEAAKLLEGLDKFYADGGLLARDFYSEECHVP